ncbi:MAG: hypothetical protein ABW148_06830, partial [Sedimenticola sp.]
VAVAATTLSADNDAGATITDLAGTDETVVLTEDNGVTDAQGAESDPEGRLVEFSYTADTQDRGTGSDNSEAITEIVLNKDVSDGDWEYDVTQLVIEDAAGADISATAGAQMNIVAGELVITFTGTAAEDVEHVELDAAVGVRLPIDDSTDFDLTVTTTTEEFDDDATSTTSPATASTSNVLHFEIEGEVAVAEASLSAVNDAGDTITDDETGADEIVVLTEDNGVTGAQGDEGFPGRRIDFDYTTETQDRGPGSDNSEAITRIVLDKGASDGNWVFDSDGDGTLDLIIEDAAGSLISEADAGLVVLNPNTDGHLELSFTNPDVEFVDLNNAIGIRLFPDDSTDFDLTVTTNTQESDDDGVSTTSPATASTSNVLHFEIEGEVAVAEASLSAVNDAGDTITDDETGADEIVVLTEDNGVTGAQGAEGFPGRRIDFDFTAKTQDEGFGSDNSEGITRIVLDK